MENAVEALKLAFAVILLTLALSLSINYFSKARDTAEQVLQSSDSFRYYDYEQYSLDPDYSVMDNQGNRIVGYETVIPTVYKYDKERYKVTFKKGNYNQDTGELTIIDNLEIYESTSKRENWNKNYTNDFDGNTTRESIYNCMKICSFDIVEETQRNEPWVGSSEQIKLNLDAIFSAGTYQKPQYSFGTLGTTIDYSSSPFKNKNKKFIEQIGEIATIKNNEPDEEDDSDTEKITGNKTTKKRIITYILIN